MHHHNSSSSLGKSLQREKKKRELGSRTRFKTILEKERMSALAAEAAQHEHGTAQTTQLKSIWETNNLESFLDIADARENGYFAERDVRVIVDGRVHIVNDSKQTPQLMYDDNDMEQEDEEDIDKNNENNIDHRNYASGKLTKQINRKSNNSNNKKSRVNLLELSKKLVIPKRPRWTYEMRADELQLAERECFHEWRRELSKIEDEYHMLLTPFEKNLEVWRQLWRVVERADVVALILDARNPLVFRCADFERYVTSFDNAQCTEQCEEEQCERHESSLSSQRINATIKCKTGTKKREQLSKETYTSDKAKKVVNDNKIIGENDHNVEKQIGTSMTTATDNRTLATTTSTTTTTTTEKLESSNVANETLETKTKHKTKKIIYILNKADLLTEDQRRAWAEYFQSKGETFYFFAAKPNTSEQNKENKTIDNIITAEDESISNNSARTNTLVKDETVVGNSQNELSKLLHKTEEKELQFIDNLESENNATHKIKGNAISNQETNNAVLENSSCELDTMTSINNIANEAKMSSSNIEQQGGNEQMKKNTSRRRKKALRAPLNVINPYVLEEQRRRKKADRNNNNLIKSKPEIVELTQEEQMRDERLKREFAKDNNDNTNFDDDSNNNNNMENATSADKSVISTAKWSSWKVLNPVELIDALALHRREMNIHDLNTPLMVGLVGYPNVGKSSTINAILGAKKVTVSATPGKTKHFQTLPIPNERRVMLCDCPGLVFPSFASTKASMTCDGILPIDNATNTMEAINVLCQRIPRNLLECLFKMELPAPPAAKSTFSHNIAHDLEEYNKAVPEELLTAFAHKRGYLVSHDGANLARAGKELLKMYVDGNHLIYVEPPPNFQPSREELKWEKDDNDSFNEKTQTINRNRLNKANKLASAISSNPQAKIKDAMNDQKNSELNDNSNEEEEEWSSVDDEAWADLDSADEGRALSDDEENNKMGKAHYGVTSSLKTHKYKEHKRHEAYSLNKNNSINENDKDDNNIYDEAPVFFIRPVHAYQHRCFTRRELFNLKSNEARIVKCIEADLMDTQRRRQRRARQHAMDGNDVVEYTFVNQDGDVELKIDDDDGVVELVNPLSIHTPAEDNVQHSQLHCGEEETNHTAHLTKRQRQRLLRKSGLDEKHANAFKSNMIHSFGVRKVGINGYM